MSTTQLGLTGTPSKQYSVTPKRAATTITKTIGTSSRDYSTITAWEADLDNTLVYVSGDDAVGECYNDATFDETITINGGGTIGLNNVTLDVALSERHDGTAGTGVRLVATSTRKHSTGANTILWLELDNNAQELNDAVLGVGNDGSVGNLLVHSGSNSSSNCRLVEIDANTTVIYNSIIYDLEETATGGADAYGIYSNGPNPKTVMNCTVHSIFNNGGSGDCHGIRMIDSGTHTYQNNIVTDTGGTTSGSISDFNISSPSLATVSHNLSSDATASGTGSITSAVTSDQYVSTVAGSEDLHLKSGSDAIGAGTDLGTSPAGVQYDIDGFDRDAANRVWDIGADQAAATITKTIGTASRDYSTITLWDADLDDSIIYQSGDDAVGECYNDSTFTDGRVQCDNHDLLSATLTVPEAERHDGTAGTGVKLDTASTTAEAFGLEPTMSMDWNFEWLEITKSTSVSKITNGVIDIDTDQVVYDVNIRNCIIHSFTALSDDTGAPAIKVFDGSAVVTNCIIYGIENQRGSGAGAAAAIEYNVGRVDNAIKVLNCTVHDIVNTNSGVSRGLNIGDEAAVEIRNCIVTDCDECYANSSPSLATMDYNISSDSTASGTGSITSATTSDQYVSTVVGSEDLHLKVGSDAIGAGVDLGTTPDGVQYDIDGVDRDARGSTWDIGADQAAATITKTIGTTARDYSTMTLWEADLDSAGYQSGDDAVGECYNDSVFTEGNLIINGGSTVGLNSIELTVAETERHDGTSGTGARWGNATTGTLILLNSNSDQTISWLDLYKTSDLGNTTSFILINTNAGDNTVRNNLIGNCRSTFGFVRGVHVFGNDHFIYNNIVYNLEQDAATSSDCTGFSTAGGNATYYNNTAVNIKNNQGTGDAHGFVTGSTSVVTNCIAMDTGGTATGSLVNIATVNETFSMSEDSSASGANCLANKVYADQFVSTVVGSEDLHLKAGSDAIGAGTDLGTTPDGVQYDIDGFDRDAANRVWDIGADQAAVTVTKTIGTAARDYSTMVLWEADLDDSIIYQSGDAALGECYNDSDFTDGVVVNGGASSGLDFVELSVAVAERHDGTAGTGVRILPSVSLFYGYIQTSSVAQPRDFRIRWIEIDCGSLSISSGHRNVVSRQGSGTGASGPVFQNMIIHDAAFTTSGVSGEGAVRDDAGGGGNTFVSNLIIYNISLSSSIDFAVGISSFDHAYNCTVYNIENTGTDNAYGISAIAATNCISTDVISSAVADCFSVSTEYNLSSDATATGTGSVTNAVTADQFVSIVSGSEDLHLKAGSDAIGAGKDLGAGNLYVSIDIDGRDRDAEGDTWDIGADQSVGLSGGSLIQLIMYNRRLMGVS